MSTITATTTSHAGALRLRVERRGERSAVVEANGHLPYAARVVPGRSGWARVALVQTLAGPLAGDHVCVEVEVGPGAALEVFAAAATVALPMDEPAGYELRVRLESGARLAWLPEPIVLAAGCDLRTTVDIELAAGAVALLREVVVLGRHGEPPGRLSGRVRAELDGTPLLHEATEIGEGAGSPAVLDGARVVGSLALLGLDAPAPGATGVLALARPGAVARALARDAATVHARLAPLEAAWSALL
jgi:urease accessory protein